MNCRIAEGMVSRYINHTLKVDELEEFLEHVESCSSCYDELETYFIVQEAITKLDNEDTETVLDFKNLLQQDLKKSKRYVRKKKTIKFFEIMIACLLMGIIISILIMGFMEIRQVIS